MWEVHIYLQVQWFMRWEESAVELLYSNLVWSIGLLHGRKEISVKFSNICTEKNPHTNGPTQFQPVLFKGQLYKERIASLSNLTRPDIHYNPDGPAKTKSVRGNLRHPQSCPLPTLLPSEAPSSHPPPGFWKEAAPVEEPSEPWECLQTHILHLYLHCATAWGQGRKQSSFRIQMHESTHFCYAHMQILSKHNKWLFLKHKVV